MVSMSCRRSSPFLKIKSKLLSWHRSAKLVWFDQLRYSGRLADDKILHFLGLNKKKTQWPFSLIQQASLNAYSMNPAIYDMLVGLVKLDRSFLWSFDSSACWIYEPCLEIFYIKLEFERLKSRTIFKWTLTVIKLRSSLFCLTKLLIALRLSMTSICLTRLCSWSPMPRQ